MTTLRLANRHTKSRLVPVSLVAATNARGGAAAVAASVTNGHTKGRDARVACTANWLSGRFVVYHAVVNGPVIGVDLCLVAAPTAVVAGLDPVNFLVR